MRQNFLSFLRHISHPGWHPSLIGCRSDDPEPDPSTPQCRVIDHTQDFRRRFQKTTVNNGQPSPTTANSHDPASHPPQAAL